VRFSFPGALTSGRTARAPMESIPASFQMTRTVSGENGEINCAILR
jgi:hypothetical protein